MKKAILAIALLVGFGASVKSSDLSAGVNLVTNKSCYIKTVSITNTSGTNVDVRIYDCSNTNLTCSVTNVVQSPQAQIGHPLSTTNVTNVTTKPVGEMTVSNGCYALFPHGLYMRGIIISNSGPLTVSLTP